MARGHFISSVHAITNVMLDWLQSLETPVFAPSIREGLENCPGMCNDVVNMVLGMVRRGEVDDE